MMNRLQGGREDQGAEPVVRRPGLAQPLEDGGGKGTGLAGAGLHLHGQVDPRPGQGLGQRQSDAPLDRVQIFQDSGVGQLRSQGLVAQAGAGPCQGQRPVGRGAQALPVCLGAQ